MTRKDFALIADIIKGMPDFAPNLRAQKLSTARAFAKRFKLVNPLFKEAVFIKACGLQSTGL